MNRYQVVGVLRDMLRGRRVVVVAGTRTEARAAFHDVIPHLRDGERAFRANGQERVERAGGGAVRFLSRTQLRGASADVVVVVGHRPVLDEEEDLRVLAASGAEVIL